MTTETETSSEPGFAYKSLPWVVAVIGLVVYAATLNHWVSLEGLSTVARASGWTWQPEIYSPLYWLLTYPFSWLPASLIPVALNLFSAVCGSLILALLARSVMLLPHDRTHEQRIREKSLFSTLTLRSAWLPPVLAAMVCGLQLTFWEHATSASGEILELLLFAYVICCVLESRIDENRPWLARASFVYGMGMANDWSMVGFFPLFLVVLIWVKGLSFFNARFLSRMFLCGLAGLSLYLVLPVVNGLSHASDAGFWQSLKSNLFGQKTALALLFKNARPTIAVLGLTSVLPVFLMGIRWASFSGDTSRLGTTLATIMFHVVQGLFLLACIWVALDPPLSPRNKGYGLPFLTFYYLGALSVGYFSGYLLLVFGEKPAKYRRALEALPIVNGLVIALVWALLILTPAVLLFRNFSRIQTTNGPMLSDFASLMLESLPERGVVVLSDDPRRILLLECAISKASKAKDHVFVTTSAMSSPDYHNFLRRKYPNQWPAQVGKDSKRRVEDVEILSVLSLLSQTNGLFYLHPSFGYYFEVFYPETHGLVYQLKFYPSNSFVAPAPNQVLIAENETFWNKAQDRTLNSLVRAVTPSGKNPGILDNLMARLHLQKEINRTATILAAYYSRALDFWGVELQKSEQWTNAASRFEQALELNRDNVVAVMNLQCNKSVQAGQKVKTVVPQEIEDEFQKYRNWDQVVGENGPFDEPNFCYEQGRALVRGKNYRQAAQQFARVKALAPENLAARLWLAKLFVMNRLGDDALKIVNEIHQHANLLGLARTNQSELLEVETSAHLLRNDIQGANSAIKTALGKYHDDDKLFSVAAQTFMNYGDYTNAMKLIEQQLSAYPTNQNALLLKGYAKLQIGDYSNAIPPLTRAIELDTNNYPAMLNRAIAYLRTEQLDAAQHDYEVLEHNVPKTYQVYFGLGEIAWRRKDTNAAIRSYELYLSNSPTNSQESKTVTARLAQLKPGSR